MIDLCTGHGLLHGLSIVIIFILEYVLGKTKFRSTVGLLTAPLKKKE